MDTPELIQKISEAHQNINKEQEHSVAQTEEKFLVFSVQDQKYAFSAEQVKEITFDNEMFFVPFVPNYVRGYINRHGEPYTVFDLRLLFSNEILESSKFLIMNIEHDQVAFIITDILQIVKVPKDQLCHISSDNSLSQYFTGSFTAKESEVFIIDVSSILKRLENDL